MLRRLLSGLAFLGLLASGCGHASDPWEKVPGNAGGKKVLVSFAPLYCFAKSIAGDEAKVLCLLASTGPHDYEPSSYDALKARGADVIFVNGLELDEFIGKVVNASGNRRAPLLKVAEEAKIKHIKMGKHDHAHDHGHGHHHHHHGEYDPHVWLGLDEARLMVKFVSGALQDIDSANKKIYADREKEYLAKIDELKKDATEALKNKKNKKIITMHDSLQYFARGLGLEIVDVIQIRPGVEATVNKIQELAKLCKEKNISVIATEPQYSPDLAKQIRDEAAKHGQTVELVEIDPIETAPPGFDASHYLERMRKNIDKLAEKLS